MNSPTNPWQTSVHKMNNVHLDFPPMYPRLHLHANMSPQVIGAIIAELKQRRREVDEKRAIVLGDLGIHNDLTESPLHPQHTKKRKASDEMERPVAEFARLFVGDVVPSPLCS
ncbi:hypothetical protein ACHHYP_09772 [Achlya hypogyna]|uniref:Uncharacterized protein n=1 Tax=Achlya hypogyna TaxID=1202772 RepID=A0A1V9YME1_ACHHY|nr:hypothetical protein ACHHYP_09772 [Achlya hypogyna]